MFNRIMPVVIITSSLLYGVNAAAENEEGTGGDSCQCVIGFGAGTNGSLVIQVDDGKTQAIGRGVNQAGFSEVTLDGMSEKGLVVDWGKAEVLASCNLADVVLYQKVDDGYKEILATQITTDYCPQ